MTAGKTYAQTKRIYNYLNVLSQDLAREIESVTHLIQEHLSAVENRCPETVTKAVQKKIREWRKKSFELHHRRSELRHLKSDVDCQIIKISNLIQETEQEYYRELLRVCRRQTAGVC